MTLHYHGTPLTPRRKLEEMAGRHFCVSFAHPADVHWCIKHGQSVMLDNGAYSLRNGDAPKQEWSDFYQWIEPFLGHPHWGVVPDVIGGTIEQNMSLISEWPFRKDCAAVVWHLHEPISHLMSLIDLGFAKVCFGSSAEYWEVGSEIWARRIDEAFNALSRTGPLPWVHMLRGLAVCGDRWPFASADSVNVARNFKDAKVSPEAMARRIDAVQCPHTWHTGKITGDLFHAL